MPVCRAHKRYTTGGLNDQRRLSKAVKFKFV